MLFLGLHSPPITPKIPVGILSGSSTPKKTGRQLRFFEGPDQIYVYESQPPSPRRVLGLLPPPTIPPENEQAKSSADLQTRLSNPSSVPPSETTTSPMQLDKPYEEITADIIRARYFPEESNDNPALEWTKPSRDPSATDTSIRYDLQGNPIPTHLIRELPSHLGLHHHAQSDSSAGYTFDDLLLLSRSTMPVQRAAMLGVLSRTLRRIGLGNRIAGEAEEEMRQKAVVVGIEACTERSSTAVRTSGIDLVFESLVGWSSTPSSVDAAVDLPLFFAAASWNLNRSSTPLQGETIVQLLQILRLLSSRSADATQDLINTPEFVEGVLRIIVSFDTERSENDANEVLVHGIKLLQFIVKQTRKCAQELVKAGAPDAVLRVIVTFPNPLHPSFTCPSYAAVAEALRFYALLGQYGMYAHAATDAREAFTRLTGFITSGTTNDPIAQTLASPWLELIEIWTVCAIDPHRTTPEHDILWSQITGWSWNEDVLRLRKRALDGKWADVGLWARIWSTCASWVYGCTVNSTGRGIREKQEMVLHIGRDFENFEREILKGSLHRIRQAARGQTKDFSPSLHSDAYAVQSGFQLRWSLQDQMDEREPNNGRFALLWDELTSPEELLKEILNSAALLNGDLETQQPWTSLLVSLLNFLPWTSQAYTKMALEVLLRLVPGDESLAIDIIAQLLRLTISTPQFAMSHLAASAHYTTNLTIDNLSFIWKEPAADVVRVLMPMYRNALWPNEEHYYPPFKPTPHSIALTSSLITPPLSVQPSSAISTSTNLSTEGLRSIPDSSSSAVPMLTRRRDWCSSPLDILLRSGNAEGRFFRSLPPGWDASEVDVVRATLLFSLALQSRPSQEQEAATQMTREEIAFMCMKVFMLEHGQSDPSKHGEVIGGEVFRDDVVERLMLALLEPFRLRSSREMRVQTSNPTLEDVSIPFLGPLKQPFFQFYTDFLGLYDSISFAHPMFGLLLLPATSLKYPRDYRRTFWGEYGHIVRSLSIDVEEVLTSSVTEWLYFPSPPTASDVGEPWDTKKREDGEMVGFYLKALIRHGAKGFAQFVAVHHVSTAIWPDLRLGSGAREENMAKNVLKALLGGVSVAEEEVLVNILGYSQSGMNVLHPPTCYRTATVDLRRQRIEWAVDICGEDVRSRFPVA
jgi:hypothetical protein